MYIYIYILYVYIRVCADATSYDTFAMLFSTHKSDESWYHHYLSMSIRSEDLISSFVSCRSLCYRFQKQTTFFSFTTLALASATAATVNVS